MLRGVSDKGYNLLLANGLMLSKCSANQANRREFLYVHHLDTK